VARRSVFSLALAALILAAIGPIQTHAATPPSPPNPAQHGGAQSSATSPAITPGGTWSWQNPKPDGDLVFGISCPSTTTCYAVDATGHARITTDSGATWSVRDTGAGDLLLSISCASTTTCVAVGHGGVDVRTTDGGATWAAGTMSSYPLQGGFLYSVSCYSTSGCYTVGQGGAAFSTLDGGVTWSSLQQSASPNLYSISCLPFGYCYADGDAGVFYVAGGVVPTNVTPPNTPLDGISCFTANIGDGSGVSPKTQCTAVGPGGYWESFVEYGNQGLPPTGPINHGTTATGSELDAVSCWSFLDCAAAGSDGSVYVGRGSFGQQSTAEFGRLFAISCPGGGRCYTAGDYGEVLTTSDGGTGWASEAPHLQSSYSGITCPSVNICFAAGQTIFASTDADAS